MISVAFQVDLSRQEYRSEIRRLATDGSPEAPVIDSVEGQRVDLTSLEVETQERATAVLTSLNRPPADLTGLRFVDGEPYEPSITERAIGGFEGSAGGGGGANGRPPGQATNPVDGTTTTTTTIPPQDGSAFDGLSAARLISFTVLVIVVVALLTLAWRAYARRQGSSEKQSAQVQPQQPKSPTAGRLARSAADAAEAEGRYADALRLRYEAGLHDLDRLGVLSFLPSLPNGVYRTQVLHRSFDRLTDQFDRSIYGLHPTGRQDLDASKEEWSRLMADLTGREQSRV